MALKQLSTGPGAISVTRRRWQAKLDWQLELGGSAENKFQSYSIKYRHRKNRSSLSRIDQRLLERDASVCTGSGL